MTAGSTVLEGGAPAPPEAGSAGGLGVGSTPMGVVPPKFCPVSDALKVWPVVSAAGMSKLVMRRSEPACTEAVLLVAGADVTRVLELASVPATAATRAMLPVSVPFSSYLQVKVADPPPGMVAGLTEVEVEAAAPPVVVATGGLGTGRTTLAAAWPMLATTMVAVKLCPRAMVPGTAKETMESWAGAWTCTG